MQSNLLQAAHSDVVQRTLALEPRETALHSLPLLCRALPSGGVSISPTLLFQSPITASRPVLVPWSRAPFGSTAPQRQEPGRVSGPGDAVPLSLRAAGACAHVPAREVFAQEAQQVPPLWLFSARLARVARLPGVRAAFRRRVAHLAGAASATSLRVAARLVWRCPVLSRAVGFRMAQSQRGVQGTSAASSLFCRVR